MNDKGNQKIILWLPYLSGGKEDDKTPGRNY